MEGSSQIHEVPPATNIKFSHCHLWGTLHNTCRDRGLSKLQTLVCSIRWSFQHDMSPGHFLIGEPLTQLLAADYTNVKCNRLSRWQTYQQLQQFWQRWTSGYLQSLQQRKRWQGTSPNLQIGDLVLLREDMTPLQWPTDVITDTHAGKDGIVRVVTLRTPKGTFKRPTTKIWPLPRGNSELYDHFLWGGSMSTQGKILCCHCHW